MAFKMLPYSAFFSKQQINLARSLGTTEQDMHKTLLNLERKKTPEEVKEEILLEMEGKRCPHCQKVWPVDQKIRYRNRHRNACEKLQAKKNQAQFSEQTQSVSSSEASQRSPSPASPNSSSQSSTASSQTSISSQSQPAKRKLDDGEGPSSGDVCAAEAKDQAITEQQSTARPSAKRPKTADENHNEPLIGKASFKQQPGAIGIDRARETVTWLPENHLIGVQPVVIRMRDLINFQRNTAAGGPSKPNRGLVLKIITQAVGELVPAAHTFRFPSTNKGRRDADAFSDILSPFGKAARSRELDSHMSTGRGPVLASQGLDVIANVERTTLEVGVADTAEENDGAKDGNEDSSDVEWDNVI
jgi:hypothetical protein